MPTPDQMSLALANFPDKMAAENAKKWGFTYAHPDSPYLEGKKYTTIPFNGMREVLNVAKEGTSTKVRMPEKDVTGDEATLLGALDPSMHDLYMRNALASKRSALAQLGWDPKNTVLNISNAHVGNNLGFHVPRTLQNYVDTDYANEIPGTMTHEGIHRGITKLMDTPYWDPAWNYIGTPLVKGHSERFPEGNKDTLANNESVIRWLMKHKMGVGGDSDSNPTETLRAEKLFSAFPRMMKDVNAMEAAAARYLAAGKPNPGYVPQVVLGPR